MSLDQYYLCAISRNFCCYFMFCKKFVKIIKKFVKLHNFFTIFFAAHGEDDGVFWIAFEDVLKYFDCIDICKVRSGWNEVRVSGILPPLSSKQHQG